MDEGVSLVVLPGELQLELDVLEVFEETFDLVLQLRHLGGGGFFLRQELQKLLRVGDPLAQPGPLLDRRRQGRTAL